MQGSSHVQPAGSLHHGSRGLSKLSEIDSDFQISGVSPRGPPTAQQSAAGQAARGRASKGLGAADAQDQRGVTDLPSSSTRRTRPDVDQLEQLHELEARLQRQREDSEGIILALKASQAELVARVHDLEQRLREAGGDPGLPGTPSLGNSAARARSGANRQPGEGLLERGGRRYEGHSTALEPEQDEREARLRALQEEHAKFTQSLKLQIQSTVSEQTQAFEELKERLQRSLARNAEQEERLDLQQTKLTELRQQASLDEDERNRLRAELSTANRQLQVLRAQVAATTRSREADERRLESHKDQERHWKSGYESIYQKYSKLKEQAQQREEHARRLEEGHRTELQMLTRRAEEAIRYFKELAVQRGGERSVADLHLPGVLDSQRRGGDDLMSACLSANLPASRSRCLELREAIPRVSRYTRGTCTESKSGETYQLRSRSVNSPQALDTALTQQSHGRQHVTRAGKASAVREVPSHGHSRNATLKSPNPYHRASKQSHSPNRTTAAASLHPELLHTVSGTQQSRGAGSPRQRRKITLLERLQTLTSAR